MNGRTSAKGMGEDFEKAGGADREANLTKANEALENMAKAVEIDEKSLSGDLVRAMLEQFRNRPKPFAQLSADEQSDIVKALTFSAEEFTRKAVYAVAAAARPHVKGKVKSLTDDGAKIKLVLEIVNASPEDLKDIHSVMARDVVVVLADSRDHLSSAGEDLVQADQVAMSFDGEEVGD